MRLNTFVLAVFVLISSALAAPLHNRLLARRSMAPRAVQAVLSKSPPAICDSADANGVSWSEELCSKMPHVTGFIDPANGGCRRPTNVGGGTGTCYIKSDRPIPHIYRRMIPAGVLSEVANPSDPTPLSSVHSATPSSPEPSSADSSDDTSSTATLHDAIASPPTPTTPKSTGSAEPPVSVPTNGSEDTTIEVPPPQTHTGSGDSQHLEPNSVPSHKPEGVPPTADKVPSPVTEVDVQATLPSATNDTPVAEATPAGVSPVQAPFAAPKSKSATTSVVKEAAAAPFSSSRSTSSSRGPTATAPAIPAANVPIVHGTEGTWGGTLVNTINGMRSPLAGARKEASQKPMKLGTVIGTLFFDVVYGRFLV